MIAGLRLTLVEMVDLIQSIASLRLTSLDRSLALRGSSMIIKSGCSPVPVPPTEDAILHPPAVVLNRILADWSEERITLGKLERYQSDLTRSLNLRLSRMVLSSE